MAKILIVIVITRIDERTSSARRRISLIVVAERIPFSPAMLSAVAAVKPGFVLTNAPVGGN